MSTKQAGIAQNIREFTRATSQSCSSRRYVICDKNQYFCCSESAISVFNQTLVFVEDDDDDDDFKKT